MGMGAAKVPDLPESFPKLEKMYQDLRQIGAPYLPVLEQAHAVYGSALGITDKKAAAPDPTRVLEPLRALQAAASS